jgi:hypothetical protein
MKACVRNNKLYASFQVYVGPRKGERKRKNRRADGVIGISFVRRNRARMHE